MGNVFLSNSVPPEPNKSQMWDDLLKIFDPRLRSADEGSLMKEKYR